MLEKLSNKELDTQFERLNTLFGLLLDFEFFGDFARCKVRDEVADGFPKTALKAAEEAGYEDDEGNPDPHEAYPEEIYAYLNTSNDKQIFIKAYKEAIASAMS